MTQKIKIALRMLLKYGMWNSLSFYIKFLRGDADNFILPNLKFPFSLRPNTSDFSTFYQIFIKDEYNIKYSGSPSLIVDAGSNIGLFALKIKNQFPHSKIICIEPDPENFDMLTKNLNKYEGVSYENKGLWHKDTILRVFDKYDAGKWGMVVEENLQGNINAISITSLLNKYSIDYIDVLKIDIETSEKQLFSENYEEWLPKVKMIIVELHDYMESGCSKAFFTAINKCFKKYSFCNSGENVIIINEDLS